MNYLEKKNEKLRNYAAQLEKYVPVKSCKKFNGQDYKEKIYTHENILEALKLLENNNDIEIKKLYQEIFDKVKIYTYKYLKENMKETIFIKDIEDIRTFDSSNMEFCGCIVIGREDYFSYYDEENLQPYYVWNPAPGYKQYKNLEWFYEKYGTDYKVFYPEGYNKDNIQEFLDKHNLGKAG